jgi:O-antigen/teichoic acid export membrane protein
LTATETAAGGRLSRLTGGAAGTGVLLLGLSMLAHVGNYLFYVVALRLLGPVDYAQLAAVTAIGNIAFLPFSGVQAAVAREIAAARALGRDADAGAAVRWMVRRVAIVQVGLFGALAMLWPVAERVWSLSSSWIWLAGIIWLALGAAVPSWLGVAQGEQRFALVGAVLAGPQGTLRVLFLVPLALVWGVAGALWALVAAAMVGLVMLAPAVRRSFVAAAGGRRQVPQLLPTVVALLAFGSMTNVDVPVVRALMSGVDAGNYSAAALLAKVAYYAPAVLALMLLPSVTARLAGGRAVAGRILATLAATTGSGLLVLLGLVTAPRSVIAVMFGPALLSVYDIAIALTVVMTCAAVLNVHLMVALATKEVRFVYLLVGGAVFQLVLLLILGSTATGAVVASAIAFGLLLVCYEVISPYGSVRLLLTWHRENR